MDLEKRLETLEKKLLFHKRLWMGAACLLVAVLLAWAFEPVPKTIVAQEFILKDSSGELHSKWGTHKGLPYFTIADKKGTRELTLGTDEFGGLGLFLIDRKDFGDKIRIFVGIQKKMTGIIVADKGGIPRAGLGIGEEEGKVAISIFDPSKNIRATLFFSRKGESNLVLLDGKKNIIWRALPKPE